MSKMNEYVITPGETILELLEENHITQVDLASKLGLTKKTINEIIKGKAAITPETALKLEYVFGIPAHFWNQLESQYRETLLRQKEYEALLKETQYLKDIPYGEMVKRNWVEGTRDATEKVKNLRKFFSVASLHFDTELKNKMAFRKADGKYFSFNALYCWIRYGEKESTKETIENFDVEKLKKTVPKIRELTKFPFLKKQEEIKKRLASCGVFLVVEPCLPNTYVSGVSYKITANKALIMLSGRSNRDDSIWFTLFHEIAHLLKHSKKEIFIDYEKEENSEIEAQANHFSKNILINEIQYQEFVQNNDYSESAIIAFAKKINVHTGIVVGRLQKDGYLAWSTYNHLVLKIWE